MSHWPAVESLPRWRQYMWHSDLTGSNIQPIERFVEGLFRLVERAIPEDCEAFSLISEFMRWDPSKRLRADHALKHPATTALQVFARQRIGKADIPFEEKESGQAARKLQRLASDTSEVSRFY